jgi:hypothetical protein
MAARKIQQTDIHSSEPDINISNSDIPDGFPPKGQYTAKAIAEAFGFDASGIEKYYYPEATELYQVAPHCLKAGHLFTQTFYDLMFQFRQHRMRERLVLNEKGQIIRHIGEANRKGKPVLEKNSDRMTAAEFKDWFWDRNPELIPLVAEDSVQAMPEPQARQVEVEVDYSEPAYEEDVSDSVEGTLAKTENFGMSFQEFRAGFIQQFRNEGKAIASEGIKAMHQEIETVTQDFFGGMKKAVKRTK